VFFDPLHGQSAAEMDLALKNTLSHRGQALSALQHRLQAALG
ncbi:MAG: non-canonical purine NTP pyrophosphatase, partial [Oxalobacteraceae bacterium]